MYVSTLIDLIVYILLIEFGFLKLLEWFYEGPHAHAIFTTFSVAVFLVVLWLVIGGRTKNE
jgi:hypothetical protein